MALILALIVGILFSACCLWAGMKITKVQGTFVAMLIIAIISTPLNLIPFAGWILGTVVMFILICKFTSASFWPDAILMVLVARLVAMAGQMLLISLF